MKLLPGLVLLLAITAEAVPVRCIDLVRQLGAEPPVIQYVEQLKFTGVGTRDVYNPTAPFEIKVDGKVMTVMAARVEARDQEHAQVVFFKKSGDHWSPIHGSPVFDMQDPFVTRIGNETIFGGVQIFPKPEGGLGYKTAFYRTQDLMKLKQKNPMPFAEGPLGMKDIRLLSLPGGKILMATRPQGGENGPGRVGFKVLNSLGEVTPESALSATLLPELFAPGEWGGVNEMHLLKDGRVGVLGHIAQFGEKVIDGQKVRHYYPMTFIYDPKTGTHTTPKIILQRSDFDRFGLTQESKRRDLADVLFSGGLVRHPDGSALLMVGAGDAKVVRVELAQDPFLGY